ncbi:DUF6584 family protein [Streptomyces sp. NPDC091027]|uniref:DUF6584 family protein n=1 Tax=Streptomyces sp. NPDC091027 TaxID=3365971 RepID=UPI003809F805
MVGFTSTGVPTSVRSYEPGGPRTRRGPGVPMPECRGRGRPGLLQSALGTGPGGRPRSRRAPASARSHRLVSSFPTTWRSGGILLGCTGLYGDAVEPGRWMYLEEDRDADETAAFDARYGSLGRERGYRSLD